jgi:hypothetical protein
MPKATGRRLCEHRLDVAADLHDQDMPTAMGGDALAGCSPDKPLVGTLIPAPKSSAGRKQHVIKKPKGDHVKHQVMELTRLGGHRVG